MRVLLRHVRSGFYYAGGSRWVPRPASACDFKEVEAALRKLSDPGLREAEITLAFDDSGLGSRFSSVRAVYDNRKPPGTVRQERRRLGPRGLGRRGRRRNK